MTLKQHAITAIFLILTTVASAIAIAWWNASPDSNVAITTRRIQIDAARYIEPTETRALLERAGIPLPEQSTNVRGTSSFTLVQLNLQNISSVEAKNVELRVKDAVVLYDGGSGTFLRPQSDGTVQIGRLLPREIRPVYGLFPNLNFAYSMSQVIGIVGGRQINNYPETATGLPLGVELQYLLKQYPLLGGLVLLWVTLPVAIFMLWFLSWIMNRDQRFRVVSGGPLWRKQVLADASYIERHFPQEATKSAADFASRHLQA